MPGISQNCFKKRPPSTHDNATPVVRYTNTNMKKSLSNITLNINLLLFIFKKKGIKKFGVNQMASSTFHIINN